MSPKRKSVTWWNKDLEKSKRKVRRLFNQAKSVGNWNDHRAALTTHSSLIRKAKRASWRKFCEEIDSSKTVAKLHRIMSKDPLPPMGTLVDPNGRHTTCGKETLKVLLSSHFPGCIFDDNNSEQHSFFDIDGDISASPENWEVARKLSASPKLGGQLINSPPLNPQGKMVSSRRFYRMDQIHCFAFCVKSSGPVLPLGIYQDPGEVAELYLFPNQVGMIIITAISCRGVE